ncbi:hypothetical protein ACXM1Q_005495 [Streptococcus sp. 10F2]
MAKKNLRKIDSELEEAKKKVVALEQERKQAEEEIQRQIGKTYFQLQRKKDNNKSYQEILEDLKLELSLLKEEEKERKKAAQRDRENPENNNFNGYE